MTGSRKLPNGWKVLEFASFSKQVGEKPRGNLPLRCVELEHIGQNSGRLIGWRTGDPNETSKVAFSQGDVLFGKLRPYLKKSWLATFDGMCSSEIWVLRVDEAQCEKEFLHHLTLSDTFSAATHASAGSKMPRAQWDLIADCPFLLPPRKEQRRIAGVLGVWDRALERLEKLIEAKMQFKQAVARQLVTGKRRFKEFAKLEWQRLKISDFARATQRVVPKPDRPFMALGIRSHGKGVFIKPDFDPAAIDMTELYEVRKSDLIVNITFAWEGAIAIAGGNDDGGLVSHRFPTYVFDIDRVIPEYFRHVILQRAFVLKLGLISPGGAGRNRVLSKRDFAKIEVEIPPLPEQRLIASVLEACDRELVLLERKAAALRDQKKGLMQQLLTGKVRVKG